MAIAPGPEAAPAAEPPAALAATEAATTPATTAPTAAVTCVDNAAASAGSIVLREGSVIFVKFDGRGGGICGGEEGTVTLRGFGVVAGSLVAGCVVEKASDIVGIDVVSISPGGGGGGGSGGGVGGGGIGRVVGGDICGGVGVGYGVAVGAKDGDVVTHLHVGAVGSHAMHPAMARTHALDF